MYKLLEDCEKIKEMEEFKELRVLGMDITKVMNSSQKALAKIVWMIGKPGVR